MTTTTPSMQTLSADKTGAWDLVTGFLSWRLWAFLGLQDIRQRYRRSSFGPLWLALGLGVTILGIGILYSEILKVSPGNFIPFLSISLLIWNFLTSVVNESTGMFQSGAGMMTSMRTPYSAFALRCIVRNLVVMVHCVAPAAIAFVYFKYPVGATAVAALPGFILLVANMYWIALAIGLVCLRYRDVAQIVLYTMQLALFLTPIIWQPTSVHSRGIGSLLAYNPLYHMVQLIRGPVFDHVVPFASFRFCAIMLVVGGGVTVFAFMRARRYMVYWI